MPRKAHEFLVRSTVETNGEKAKKTFITLVCTSVEHEKDNMISEAPSIIQVQAVYSFKGKNNDEVCNFTLFS